MRRVGSVTDSLENTKVIHVMDREADIYQLFSEAEDLSQAFIIRSCQDRRINKSSRASKDGSRLYETLSASKPLGTAEIEVRARGEIESKRLATVELRALRFKLTAPRAKSQLVHRFERESLELSVIQVREVNEEEGIEPIDWTLVTNVHIGSVEDVLTCVGYYCLRWHIEVFHRILKTGCRVERCRLTNVVKIKTYVALLTIVAWRIHWLTMLARHSPSGSAALAFTEQEQSVLSQLVLHRKPSPKSRVGDYVTLLARLGGYLNRKHDGPPGAEVLWRGHMKLKDFLHNLSILQEVSGTTYV